MTVNKIYLFLLLFIVLLLTTSCQYYNKIHKTIKQQNTSNNPVSLEDGLWIKIEIPEDARKYIPEYQKHGYYIMHENIQRELEKSVKDVIKDNRFPDDYIYFIKSEIIEQPERCPTPYTKAILFSFAAPDTREFIPEAIFKAYLDDRDITQQVYFRSSRSNRLHVKFAVVQGVFNPKGFINTNVDHMLKISLSAKDGTVLSREIPFSLPKNQISEMKSAGFDFSQTGKEVEIDDETLLPIGRCVVLDESNPSRIPNQVNLIGGQYYVSVEERLKQLIGNIRPFPNDVVLFLGLDASNENNSNPPDFTFNCFVPSGDFAMSDIVKVIINNEDVTQSFRFSQFRDRHFKYDTCTGYYIKRSFFKPGSEHSFELHLTPGDGNTYIRKATFKVPEVECIKLGSSGFPVDEKTHRPQRNKYRINAFFTDNDLGCEIRYPGCHTNPVFENTPHVVIDIEDMLNPDNWKFDCEDKSPLPKLKSITHDIHGYLFEFEDDLPTREKEIYVKLELPYGVHSDSCRI